MRRTDDQRWRRGALGAALVSGVMLGLRDGLRPKEHPPIVVDDLQDEPEPEDFVLFFHPQVPEATLLLVKSPGEHAFA